jgi:hypothetical protein
MRNPVLHSGGPGLKHPPEDRLLWQVFRDIPQSLTMDARKVPEIRPRPPPHISFPIHRSLVILPFDAA